MTKWEESDCIDCPGANIKNGLIKHEMSLTSPSLTWAHVMPNGVRCVGKKGTQAKVGKKVLTELNEQSTRHILHACF